MCGSTSRGSVVQPHTCLISSDVLNCVKLFDIAQQFIVQQYTLTVQYTCAVQYTFTVLSLMSSYATLEQNTV